MSLTLRMPDATGRVTKYFLRGMPAPWGAITKPAAFNRAVYSAAHVVANPLTPLEPLQSCALDWDATIRYRQRLWSLGLGVAEAMDTAQRGGGLDWPTSLSLIEHSLDAAQDFANKKRPLGSLIACGCGTDHLGPDVDHSVDDVIAAYEYQMAAIEKLGGKLIIMASRALAKAAKSPADYERVYSRILSQARQPVILHWLGEMFDPALSGYWGSADLSVATDTVLGIINAHADKVDGIKISLLDATREVDMRRRLPLNASGGVRMYTGDDFNYADLIAGDGFDAAQPHLSQSDALLGIFDAIAPAASAALGALAAGDEARFRAILEPTVPLSRHMFQAPTRYYKTGVVFMAWLNGHQSHFTLVGGQQSARSLVHLCELVRLADAANLIEHPDMAAKRIRHLLAMHGVN